MEKGESVTYAEDDVSQVRLFIVCVRSKRLRILTKILNSESDKILERE
jgi:hypothetical protein